MKILSISLVTLSLLSALPRATQAQDSPASYPARPITFHIAYPVGGSADTIGRIVLPALSQQLGQPIVIENRSGAGGVIGLTAVARSRPDGYTMGFGTAGTLASNVNLVPHLPYHPLKDLAPVSMVVNNPLVLVVSASSPIRSVQDLLKQAKADDKAISYGSAGLGSSTHLAGELLKQLAQINMAHVPYKGTGPAVTDLLGGHLQAAFVDLPTATPHVQAGRLRILGVTSSQRSTLIPDVPTIAEQGVAKYHFISWFGVVMPAGTPAAIVERVNRELVAVLKDNQIGSRILAAGADPYPSTPQRMSQIIQSEIESTGRIIRSAGIKLEQ